MKRFMTSSIGWALIGSTALCIAEADVLSSGAASRTNEPAFYPWSESSDYVRVPKSLLSQFAIQPVAITNFETMVFVLTDEFVRTFRLTPQEVKGVTAGMADALHQWRMEEAKHLEPTDEEPKAGGFPRGGIPAATAKVHFRPIPFPIEAAAIRRKLENHVLATLGHERAKIFWENGQSRLEGEMSTFSNEAPLPPGMTRTTTYTFVLKSGDPPSGIDRFRTSVTTDARGSGGQGVDGRPYGKPLDQYAPEKMKPILANWRKMIAGSKAQSDTSASGVAAPTAQSKAIVRTPPATTNQTAAATPPSAHAKPVAMDGSRWDDAAVFVDLPKSLIRSLKVPGLTLEGEISSEAISLFGLSPSDCRAVRAQYEEMKLRFERIELEHFVRVQPDKNSFVLKAFPEKSAALQNAWLERLKELVGRTRGEMLDTSIRTPVNPMQIMKRGGPPIGGRLGGLLGDSGRDWLHRGTSEVQVDISAGPVDRNGQPTIRIEYRSEGEGGAKGSLGGTRDQIPVRWRHLLPPDILGAPLTL